MTASLFFGFVCGKGLGGQAASLKSSGRRFAPTPLRCSGMWRAALYLPKEGY
jgi:hypothetical protein